MVLNHPAQHLGTRLKIATIVSYTLILITLIFSLALFAPQAPATAEGVSSSSSWASSWSTWTPFSALGHPSQRNEPKQHSIPSADGLLGDFIPESETRPSRGALKSMGQKQHFKENLRDDKKYLTSWPVAGWNNQVICFMNLIYFAIKSHRIPIVPDFTPYTEHLNDDQAPLLRFGEVFDLPRLSALLNTPIVEMQELKSNGGERLDRDKWAYDDEFPEFQNKIGEYPVDALPKWEEIGCWSWAKTTRFQEAQPGHFYALHHQNTPLPERTIGQDWERGALPKPLISLLQPNHPLLALDPYQQAVISNHSDSLLTPEILPSDDVACVDETYFLDTRELNTEFGIDGHMAWLIAGHMSWNEVGRHMYFAPALRKLTHGVLRRTFGLDEDEKVPTYVAVHMRRTDFPLYGNTALTPLDYSYYVAKALDQTKGFMGFIPKRVLVMTDETDETWLAELKTFGWYHINHVKERTAELYGAWYPTLIDGVAMSEGVAFVGLHDSTMAAFAYQRVRTWHGGVGHLLKRDDYAPKDWQYPYMPKD